MKRALEAGKTTALVCTGGTEQRGPQNVNGGHNLMGRDTVKAIALKLGNAIAMPVLPYTPNNASAQLPGTIGLTNELLAALLERIAEHRSSPASGTSSSWAIRAAVNRQPIRRSPGSSTRNTRRRASTCTVGGARGQSDPNAPPRLNNGITGDARPSTAELGKMLFDKKVEYAVRQIRQFIGTASK